MCTQYLFSAIESDIITRIGLRCERTKRSGGGERVGEMNRPQQIVQKDRGCPRRTFV